MDMRQYLQVFINETKERLEELNKLLFKVESKEADSGIVDEIFRIFHTLKGMSGTMNFKETSEFVHEVENVLQEIRKSGQQIDENLLDLLYKCEDVLEVFIQEIANSSDEPYEEYQSIINQLQNIENNKKTNEKITEENKQKEYESLDKKIESKIRNSKNSTIRVDVERLSFLTNLASELMVVKTQLDEIKIEDKNENKRDIKYNELMEYFTNISINLYHAVMKVRMVSVDTVFNRFTKMVRDISKSLNKEIEFSIFGGYAELDRSVVDEIGDPIIHILRNSIDHGIESPEERISRNKSKCAKLRLSARQVANEVLIEVYDDGRGINFDKVKKKAIEKGLISKELEYEDLSKEELIDLLFIPGFSTAEQITDLSGRGVGLDVVKLKISELGGKITIETKELEWTKVIISIPLDVSLINVILVSVGNEKYALPLSDIRQIIRVSIQDIKIECGKEYIEINGNLIPIVRLHEILDIDGSFEKQSHIDVLLLSKGKKMMGIIVDKLIKQQRVVKKSLGKFFFYNKVVTGAFITGKGEVILIINITSLL